jgi:hypothetical protein
MATLIKIYYRNTDTITYTVSGFDVTGYTPYLTVKKNIDDTLVVLSKIGTVTDSSTAVFNISSTDSSISPGDYLRDITFEADNSIYTAGVDIFRVLKGVRY